MTTVSSDKQLSKLIEAISVWRQNRRGTRESIPEDILISAGKLAEDYSVGFVAKQLNLNHGRLKSYFKEKHLISIQPEIVEIKGFSTALEKAQVEIVKPCGIKFSAQVNHQDLKMIVNSFVGGDNCYN